MKIVTVMVEVVIKDTINHPQGGPAEFARDARDALHSMAEKYFDPTLMMAMFPDEIDDVLITSNIEEI